MCTYLVMILVLILLKICIKLYLNKFKSYKGCIVKTYNMSSKGDHDNSRSRGFRVSYAYINCILI